MTSAKILGLAPVKNQKLADLITEIGFHYGDHPLTITECFTGPKDFLMNLSKNASALSRMLKKLLVGTPIEGQFYGKDHLLSYLFEGKDKCLLNMKLFKTWGDEALDGGGQNLLMAAALTIVRYHDEAKSYPVLMQMRKAIEAVADVQKFSAKGGHTGEYKNEVQASVKKAVSQAGFMMLPVDVVMKMFRYIANQAILNSDLEATAVYREVYLLDQSRPMIGNQQN